MGKVPLTVKILRLPKAKCLVPGPGPWSRGPSAASSSCGARLPPSRVLETRGSLGDPCALPGPLSLLLFPPGASRGHAAGLRSKRLPAASAQRRPRELGGGAQGVCVPLRITASAGTPLPPPLQVLLAPSGAGGPAGQQPLSPLESHFAQSPGWPLRTPRARHHSLTPSVCLPRASSERDGA